MFKTKRYSPIKTDSHKLVRNFNSRIKFVQASQSQRSWERKKTNEESELSLSVPWYKTEWIRHLQQHNLKRKYEQTKNRDIFVTSLFPCGLWRWFVCIILFYRVLKINTTWFFSFFFLQQHSCCLLRQRFTTVTWSNENLRKISQFRDLRHFVTFGERVRLFIISILYLNGNSNSSPIHIGTKYVWTGLWLSHSTELERNASIDRLIQHFGFWSLYHFSVIEKRNVVTRSK